MSDVDLRDRPADNAERSLPVTYSLHEVEYFSDDGDDDGRAESLMLIFPDRTLICVSDNDGDGWPDYAAIDVHLTKTVDLAIHRNGGLIETQRPDGEGTRYHEEFSGPEFAAAYPGWARLLALEFPGGEPSGANVEEVISVVNELLLPDWTRRLMPWREGGLYRTPSGDGGYGVLKLLKVDAVGVHVRQYSNQFDAPPSHIDERDLFLAPFDPDDTARSVPMGMGHLPVSARTFRAWSPTLVQQSTVHPDELTGYESWREAGGGYF